jgi:hypothetical protein
MAALLAVVTFHAWADDCTSKDARPVSLHPDYGDGARYRGIRMLGSLRLSGRQVDGLAVHGLSGLSWSAAQQRLYAVSDLGFLVVLAPHFTHGMLIGASYCAAFALRDGDGVALRDSWRDAEGLSLRPATATRDEELLISFEQHPRVERYTTEGRYLGSEAVPPVLRDPRRYVSPNRALEALTETRRFGIVVAPELPLRGQSGRDIPLFALHGPRWSFHSLDADYSGLVGLETLPDDNLLVLERRYISPLHPLIIALSRVTLNDDPTQAARQEELVRFDTSAGWAMDNFESVARHEGNRYFMVSDDNASPLQQSLLVYFEVLEGKADGPAPLPAPPLSRHRL